MFYTKIYRIYKIKKERNKTLIFFSCVMSNILVS